jgi:large subunit ribosomal protein L21
MFAIVATSGKQFKVTEGDRIVVDHVPANVGQTVRLESVLMVGGDDKPLVGTPFVEGAAVEATVVAHRAGDKIIVFKFQPRKRRRRKIGHRQLLSELRIGAIRPPGGRRSTEDQAPPSTTAKGEAPKAAVPKRPRKKAAAVEPTEETSEA